MNDPVADAAGPTAIILLADVFDRAKLPGLATADARQAIRDTLVEHQHDVTMNWHRNGGTA